MWGAGNVSKTLQVLNSGRFLESHADSLGRECVVKLTFKLKKKTVFIC